jgi:formylglycine-generating enzyme required for sulfatase activity
VAPGDATATPVALPPVWAVPAGAVVVPAGWFDSGGDDLALDGLPRRRLWVDGLLAQRFQVTNAQFCAFLDDLVAQDREAEAQRHCPVLAEEDHPLFVRGADGRFRPGQGLGRVPLQPEAPVVHVRFAAAEAYAAWPALRDGVAWRLPHDQEWEKAARGVDRRAFPWGRHLDPTWCRMQASDRAGVGRVPVDSYPVDVSPYGVRGAAGNVREWCHNGYRRTGLPEDQQRVHPDPAGPDEPYRVARGGSYASSPDACRLAGRFVLPPDQSYSALGFRLVASTPATWS